MEGGRLEAGPSGYGFPMLRCCGVWLTRQDYYASHDSRSALGARREMVLTPPGEDRSVRRGQIRGQFRDGAQGHVARAFAIARQAASAGNGRILPAPAEGLWRYLGGTGGECGCRDRCEGSAGGQLLLVAGESGGVKEDGRAG
jgi:hypothetical protein